MDIIGKKNLYFALSLIVVAPGLIALLLFGLNLSIDFTGGSRLTISFPQKVEKTTSEKIKNTLTKENLKVSTVETSGNSLLIRTSPMDQKQNIKFVNTLSKEFKGAKETQFETIGPTIGKETTINAIKAVILASILIIIYITWSFRKVPKPASSLRFGVSAIIALIHDVLVVLGIFAILGHFFGVEVDSLFVTALLTVIGFSVHDTIVVFDRIRENLRRSSGSFSQIVNDSILQTLDRSLNTSLTVLLVLFALLLFGGESIRWFVVALLIGVASGTYSSIFNAAPILVVWQEWSEKRKKITK
ncbi:protein-export membrane protein SecF [Candidatus Daviesbacteria bacterium RIFCSPHIGHO2_02_FULL_41_14]|nr:MAG: protein-export membrane protein SecF [Candidatus Daviesbacteria bacterium RIFCSPHIGHO2_02_FULL_41_14]OGH29590.1 MAG: protein-export membrane protein SecF [Candidatus Levybacteria bacterium RIFCSPHIGHO2_12_FULL_37_12]